MCKLKIEGARGVVDLSKCPFEFGSPEFINFHLKDLASLDEYPKRIRYEEEIVFELGEEGTNILIEYANLLKQVERIMLDKKIYGNPQDPKYHQRIEVLEKFYKYAYMNPLSAIRILEKYEEPAPDYALFYKGWQTFKSWLLGIIKRFKESKLYKLVKEYGDLRGAFLSLIGLRSLYFIDSISLELPKNAIPVKSKLGRYKIGYGNIVQIYEIPEKDIFIYEIRNPIMENLSTPLKHLLRDLIDRELKENFVGKDFTILFDLKVNEYKQYLMEKALLSDIEIKPKEALVMAREAASWSVGLGSPIENIALDKKYITDIYIDSENSPIYLEHREFGIVHTLFRYNREMLDKAFRNAVLSEKGKKFDENNPVVDVVVKRHSMRCHLQRPPATFGELQGALRIMEEEPFTYPQYLFYKSFTPFFTGYDDVLVTLGSSEAVLGLKGVGKTSFTAAKISAIGPRKRIVPIQDIEEIPVRAYRKRGFHIGAVKVAPSEKEVYTGKELDLVTMANALLRMGDAALIINEVRSRVAVQGIINLLNTQPGVFLLYNLHAESIEDVRDRLELVFGIPATSMFATDRYTFLKKVKFGRRGKIHRVLGYELESDKRAKKFIKVFEFVRGKNIEESYILCKFIRNKEASAHKMDNLNLKELEKELDIEFIPPVLKRRSEESGISPEQYILQAFFKGKVYYDIYSAHKKTNLYSILELDFVLEANTLANRIIAGLEDENGNVDFGEAQKEWEEKFKLLLNKKLPILKKGEEERL